MRQCLSLEHLRCSRGRHCAINGVPLSDASGWESRMWIRVAFASATLVAWGLPVRAQTVLSEAEALARFSADGVYARAARAGVDVARAEEHQAGQWPNPIVSFGREGAAGVAETITSVAQPLPVTGRLGLERRAAAALVLAAEGRAYDVVRRARADLRLAYAELASAQGREAELARTRERLTALVTALDRRVAAGDAAGFDRLRAEREVLEVDADLRTAAAERARAQGALGALIGATTAETFRVADLPATAASLPSVAALVVQARRARGDFQALAQDREAASVSALVARKAEIPRAGGIRRGQDLVGRAAPARWSACRRPCPLQSGRRRSSGSRGAHPAGRPPPGARRASPRGAGRRPRTP